MGVAYYENVSFLGISTFWNFFPDLTGWRGKGWRGSGGSGGWGGDWEAWGG